MHFSICAFFLLSPYYTFHCRVVYRELQVLPTPYHFHCVPLVVIQLLAYKEYLWSLA